MSPHRSTRTCGPKTLLALDGHPLLAPEGIIVAQIFPKEYRALPLEDLVLTDQRKYGSTMLCFYERHHGLVDPTHKLAFDPLSLTHYPKACPNASQPAGRLFVRFSPLKIGS